MPVRGLLVLFEHAEVEDSAHTFGHIHTKRKRHNQRLVPFHEKMEKLSVPFEPRKFCSIVLGCRKPEKNVSLAETCSLSSIIGQGSEVC